MERKNSRRKAGTPANVVPSDDRREDAKEQIARKRGHIEDQLQQNGIFCGRFQGFFYLVILLACISIGLVLFLPSSFGGNIGWLPDGNPFRGSSGSLEGEKTLALLHPEQHLDRSVTTIRLQWNITKGIRRPDGVSKEVYLINDMFPGPTIEARSGDHIIVNVHNSLHDEGLAIHWHGLRLEGTNLMDGAVGVTQEAISPGSDFKYDFMIGEDEAGTFWYHGHDKTQRDDGLYGGLVVHRPQSHQIEKDEFQYDVEMLFLVGDWYHRPSSEVLKWYMSARGFGNEPVPDSMLLNGYGKFDCSMAVPARPVECQPVDDRYSFRELMFQRDKRYRLRFVNTGSLAGLTVQIPGARLTLVQLDGGQSVVPASGNTLGVLYPGERADVILEWRSGVAETNMVIELDNENFGFPNPALNPKQMFPCTITGSIPTEPQMPPSPDSNIDIQSSTSPSSIVPHFPTDEFPPHPSSTFVIYTTTMKLAKHHNIPMGFINRTSWAEQSSPPGTLLSLPRDQWDKNQLVPFVTSADRSDNQWVTLVINNLDDGGHPFHLHGHSFYVLSVYPPPGTSSPHSFKYNPFKAPPRDSIAGEYNVVTPTKKDTVFVPRRGYAVIRFAPDNVGIWMLHCHVGWHLGSGMAMAWEVG